MHVQNIKTDMKKQKLERDTGGRGEGCKAGEKGVEKGGGEEWGWRRGEGSSGGGEGGRGGVGVEKGEGRSGVKWGGADGEGREGEGRRRGRVRKGSEGCRMNGGAMVKLCGNGKMT